MRSTATWKGSGTTSISATMADLGASWTVLETEMLGASPEAVRTVPTGTAVVAGPVEAGVDSSGRRHLLIPLLPGEAVAEDRAGKGVQLWRVVLDTKVMVSLVCLVPALNEVFERLALEVLRQAGDAQSPARRTAEVLTEWKELLAAAGDVEVLGDERLVGLLAELICLEQVVSRDPFRRVESWLGPEGHQHDLLYGDRAVEVKATTAREGRIVAVHGVDQLDPSPARTLHLAFHRFRAAPPDRGETLPDVIWRLLHLGVDSTELHRRLTLLGYSTVHDDSYRRRPFVVVERRLYDTGGEAFPKIVRSSFTGGDLPAGSLRLTYAIDLTNEPPVPLTDDEVAILWQTLADSPT